RIFGIERLSHIKTVKPHLIRIDAFMPKSAFFCTRVLVQLMTKYLCSFQIFLLTRYLIKQQQRSPVFYIVNIVRALVISTNVAVFADKVVHTFLDVFEVFFVASTLPHCRYTLQDNSLVVGPLKRATSPQRVSPNI